jgi:hypothetical protein
MELMFIFRRKITTQNCIAYYLMPKMDFETHTTILGRNQATFSPINKLNTLKKLNNIITQ